MLEVTNLTKKFGQFTAVDAINFSLNKGDILGFLGPNGAGKSTTMKMLSGYFQPTEGTAKIQGIDIKKKPNETKKLVGYLPETVPLYKDMTVSEFLLFVSQIRQVKNLTTRLAEILEITFLTDVSNQIIGTLSKGYRQRVGFAQAIIHDPDFLILDEPTDGLDPNQKQEVRDIITNLSQNKAIILSTHILEEMKAVCNRVIIINQGKIVIDTTPKKLLEKSNYYHNIRIHFEKEQGSKLREALEKIESVKKVEIINDKEFLVLPKNKKNLFSVILKTLNSKRIVLEGITTHQGRADEIFRDLTIG